MHLRHYHHHSKLECRLDPRSSLRVYPIHPNRSRFSRHTVQEFERLWWCHPEKCNSQFRNSDFDRSHDIRPCIERSKNCSIVSSARHRRNTRLDHRIPRNLLASRTWSNWEYMTCLPNLELRLICTSRLQYPSFDTVPYIVPYLCLSVGVCSSFRYIEFTFER